MSDFVGIVFMICGSFALVSLGAMMWLEMLETLDERAKRRGKKS